MSAAVEEVENILDAVNPNESEYEDSSGDEYVPSKEDIRDMQEEMAEESTSKGKGKKRGRKRKRQLEESGSEDDEQDNIPLAALRRTIAQNVDTDEEEDIPLSAYVRANKDKTDEDMRESDEKPLWIDGQFTEPDVPFLGTLEDPPIDGNLKTPYEFFKTIITDQMLEDVAEQTNMYAVQQNGASIRTTKKEIEIFIGLYLRMGLVQAYSVRAYWETGTRHPPVADVMQRERFKKLASSIHFENNLEVTDKKKEDKLWKIRPWMDGLQKGLDKIPSEEHNAVDEIMVPFKGHSSLKQYVKNKPHKWGFKMWGRCGGSGILYQFEVYQGKISGRNNEQNAAGNANDHINELPKKKSECGKSGDVVLEMTSKLESGKNYKVFADNYFSSLSLVNALKEKSLFYVGTVRSNRLKGCDLKPEKELKREGRGSFDAKLEVNSNTAAVRWCDTRAVDLVSSYKGVEPLGEVRRWDKAQKEYVNVPIPAIVQEYNKFMGGVDLLDALTALYKFPMKSRRWYMYIFLHSICMTVVNSWLWHKRHCQALRMKPKKLSDFQADVATALITCHRPVGRPSQELRPMSPTVAIQKAPITDVRFDGMDHLPTWGTRGRCKNEDCKSLSFVTCIKCNVYLCLNKDRNCFLDFHKK